MKVNSWLGTSRMIVYSSTLSFGKGSVPSWARWSMRSSSPAA